MSHNYTGENVSTGFYENLPCRIDIMETMSSMKPIDHRGHKIRNIDQMQDLRAASKELLYATPLRKSDRKISHENDVLNTNLEYETHKKMDNEESSFKLRNDEICSTNDVDNMNFLSKYVDKNTESAHRGETMGKSLEDRRMLNFLKDTTWVQKKVEGRKDSPNISFSRLVHEEHFAKLVHQNMNATFLERSTFTNSNNINTTKSTSNSAESIEIGDESSKKLREKEQGDTPENDILLNREWVLKKIALCAEQVGPLKKNVLDLSGTKMDISTMELYSVSNSTERIITNTQTYQGCLLIGSNGSGKTSICRSILNGASGTRGLLNRKLLCCYFLDGQNQDCHSLSTFIRTIVLQLLTHSSFTFKENSENECQLGVQNESNLFDVNSGHNSNTNEIFCLTNTTIKRRSSTPPENNAITLNLLNKPYMYSTHPPLCSKFTYNDAIKQVSRSDLAPDTNKISPNKKSKIPLAINSRVPINNVSINESRSIHEKMQTFQSGSKLGKANNSVILEKVNHSIIEGCTPLPLPKSKNCRAIIADGYYEKILNDPEILENLRVENIERNPDECFKRAVLFPLLELSPPRTTLLLVVDSIDENLISERHIISSFESKTSDQRSRNVAELLSNHIHLFPRWFFLVCTTKKQAKHIAKMFSGFKRIMLDDLRKSHVVKDVQEYIISRLNTDFRGKVKLSKEIIECLHQLYIKSNGCVLYLKKVLDGIKENFFSFREIKLIPCTLNGLYLYICQKSFNKKQYMKIRPVLNALLALTGFVDKQFLFNCVRSNNYSITFHEFEKRLDSMKNITVQNREKTKIKIFHDSFAIWLVDIKFATKKFVCDVNEGHVMVSMCYTLSSESLCAHSVRKFCYHMVKSGEYLCNKNIDLDYILMLLESQANLKDSLLTNQLNCCMFCLEEYKNGQCPLPKTKYMIEQFLNHKLDQRFSKFLCEFFKPNLPTDAKIVNLLLETRLDKSKSQESRETPLQLLDVCKGLHNNKSEFSEAAVSGVNASQLNFHTCVNHNLPHSVGESLGKIFCITETHQIHAHKGRSLIHILAHEGNHKLLQHALNSYMQPFDFEIEDFNGQTALNIAARHGYLEIVKILLNFDQPTSDNDSFCRADINHVDSDGWAPLRSASWGGHTDVVKLLVSHPDCSVDLADKEGRTALRAAAWSGHEDILKILIEAGADVNSVDNQGRTSLIAASYMGHYDVVEILLENGADVNHLDLDGRSALCVAALCGSTGYNRVISTLLEHGANADQLDNDGMSPLLVSSFEGNTEVCELLLENGADPDLADFMGRTPLWAACTAGHASVVKLLLFWGCSIDCMDSEGRTVLSIAAAQGNVTTVRQLLDRGLDETHRDNAGWTPLHYAAFEGYYEVCSQILDAGAKIDECDNEGKTPLHLAAQEGRKKCVQTLLKAHNAFVDQKAHDGKTPFRLACLEGRIDCAKILIQNGCDVNSKDADSRTTLYILALENKIDMAEYLLTETEIDVNIPDNEGRTALHVAAWQGHSAMVKLLISLGNADVNAMDFEHRTPLHSCAWQGNDQVMDILLYFGAVPDHACKQGATALGIAAQEGHEKCVSVLLKYGANPYKTDQCGRTPIKLAAKSSRLSILKTFESHAKNDSHEKAIKLDTLEVFDDQADRTVAFSLDAHDHSRGIFLESNTLLNGTHSSHSNNFYENTMQSDRNSLQKRKSVVSSQSTGSSNEVVTNLTTQGFQHEPHLSENEKSGVQIALLGTAKPAAPGRQTHSRILPDLDKCQIISNSAINKDDLFDVECMSPLYATPPHSPCSELSSPGQMPFNNQFEELGAIALNRSVISADYHFARDTHMRIILGNSKSENHSSSKSKRSGISINPAVRLFRSRFDSAAQLIRRTNNILNINSTSNRGSSSIGIRSGTFQWKKENQM